MQKKLATSDMALMTGLRCRTTINAEAMALAATTKKKMESKLTGRLGLSTMVQGELAKDTTKFGENQKDCTD